MKTKVTKVDSDYIYFDNGDRLSSDHDQDCCESHSLYLKDLTLEDFEGLEFDLSDDKFFRKIDGYGIELIPIEGHSVKIAGHGYNNGYYSTNLTLVHQYYGGENHYDITKCQEINE